MASAASTLLLPSTVSSLSCTLVEEMGATAARLRAAAEAKPMRLPVNRRVDETYHAITPDGLSVWYTIQVSPHSRIQEAIFERTDRVPSDAECKRWLDLLVVGAQPVEASGFFFQAEDGIRDWSVTGVQTCALPI